MTKQTTTGGGILGKLSNRLNKAHETHKNDETEYSKFGELPDGIKGGIAQLVEAKFDVYKEGKYKGEPYFYAAGVMVSPTEFTDKEGVTHHIEGLRTTLGPIAMCDTTNRNGEVTPFDDHVARLYNELRKLGVDTRNLNPAHLELTVAKLKQIAPHFKVRTWKGKPSEEFPEPRVNHDWQGIIKISGESTNGQSQNVIDQTGSPATSSVTPAKKAPAAGPAPSKPTPPAAPVKAPKTPAKKAPEPQPEPEAPAFSEDGDLDSLVQRANEDDPEAQETLAQMARDKGITDEQLKEAQTWKEVADLIEAPAQEGSEEPQAEEPEWQPGVNELYGYKPLDPRTRKPLPSQVHVVVLEVNEDKQTVLLRNAKDTKVKYKDVPWSSLETAE